jgi:carboxylesterase type B
MQEYWSNFATRGRPKAKKAKGWPRFKTKTYKVMGLDAPFLFRPTGFRKAQCEFWSGVYETMN